MLTRIECDALRGVANCAFAPRCRAKPHKGFLRDVGASASRAVRSSPRPGVRGSTLCVHVVEYHIQRPETMFVATRHCVIYSK